MTTTQTADLAAAFNSYNDKKAFYEEAENAYNVALNASLNPSLKAIVVADAKNKRDSAKQAMNNAFTAYNTLRDDFAAQDAAAFAAANPSAYVDIQKAQLEAASQTSQAKAQAEEQSKVDIAKAQADAANKLYSQKNTQYLIMGGIAITFLIVVVWAYKKFM